MASDSKKKEQRGAKKGERRGGRAKGTPNKDRQALIDLVDQKFPGWNPVVQMAGVANDEELPIEMRFSAAKEVAPYLFAKRKSIDVSPIELEGEIGVTLRFVEEKSGRGGGNK